MTISSSPKPGQLLSAPYLARVLSHFFTVSLLLFYMLLLLVPTASGLTCVQCVSVETPNCLHGDMTPKPCKGADIGSTFCLKSVGTQVSGHGHFVFRTCSKSMQTNCTLSYIEGDMYTICHNSCVEDGCNRASSASISLLAFGLVWIYPRL